MLAIKVTGKTYEELVVKCTPFYQEGYRPMNADVEIVWPFFWLTRYFAVLVKPTHHNSNPPPCPQLSIERQLQLAIESENYEEAARLRDEINNQKK